jgi:hypothetical protein
VTDLERRIAVASLPKEAPTEANIICTYQCEAKATDSPDTIDSMDSENTIESPASNSETEAIVSHAAAIVTQRNSPVQDDSRYPREFPFGPQIIPDHLCRSVVIYNIPAPFTLQDVLQHVRGGVVVDIRLTIDLLSTGLKTALVRFSTHREAVACVGAMKTLELNNLAEGRFSLCARLSARTSWPLNMEISSKIRRGVTRCFGIHTFPPELVWDLWHDLHLDYPAARVVDVFYKVDGEDLIFHCASVEDALQFEMVVRLYERYREQRDNIYYLSDPCAGVSDELSRPVAREKRISLLDIYQKGQLKRWSETKGWMIVKDTDGSPRHVFCGPRTPTPTREETTSDERLIDISMEE